MNRADKDREYAGNQFELVNQPLDGLDNQLQAVMRRLDHIMQTIEQNKLMPKVLPDLPPNPHLANEAWWIFQTERDNSNGKVGMAYWGPFADEARATSSPLYHMRRNQKVVKMFNPVP